MKPDPSGSRHFWWQQRWFVLAVALLSAVPLLWPDIPPLIDLPGHMGRYKVQLDLDSSPFLARFYDFEWALIGNLGVDLLVVPLSKLVGLETAVKLIVLSIPPLTVAGFLWVAREVHGRIPPTALFALPFAYNYPFHFGFANFSLSMALAFIAFGLWLRLARLGHFRARALIFPFLSMLIWVVHTFGWGVLGVMAFSAELVRQWDAGRPLIQSGLRSALHCMSMTPPILLMLAWRSGDVSGETSDWFNFGAKFKWLYSALRDRWLWFDWIALACIVLLLFAAAVHRKLGYSRNLAASALFLLLVFLLLPRIVFGSAYADMRLAPFLFAVAVIAIRLKEGARPRLTKALAIAGLTFFLIRTAGTTMSFWIADRSYDRQLAALDHLPRGARVVSFVGKDCRDTWAMSRLDHLPALAITRREAFANDQWDMPGAQLLKVRYPEAGYFASDPSQLVTPNWCRSRSRLRIDDALRRFPRGAFDYVWLIDPPAYDPALARNLRPVWRDGSSALFRVTR